MGSAASERGLRETGQMRVVIEVSTDPDGVLEGAAE